MKVQVPMVMRINHCSSWLKKIFWPAVYEGCLCGSFMNPLFSLNFLFVSLFPLFSRFLTLFETQLLPLDKRYHVFFTSAYPEHFFPSPNSLNVTSVFCLCSLHLRHSWPPLLTFLLFSECLWSSWDPSPGHRRYSGGLPEQKKAVSSKDFS